MIKIVIFLLIIFIFIFIISNFIIYTIAKQFCNKEEIKPIRYSLGGLFGNKIIPIVTTKENADNYEKVCIEIGKPKFFSISDNLRYILNKTKEKII